MSDGVVGVGGIFIRARDPSALAAWYHDRLGIDAMVEGESGDPEDNRFELWEPAPEALAGP